MFLTFKSQWLLYIPPALTFRNFKEFVHQLTGTETENVYGGFCKLAGSPFVSVKIDGLGELFGTEVVNFDSFRTS